MTEETEAPITPLDPSTPAVPRALLIDIDNCPKRMDHLPKNLDGFSRIVIPFRSALMLSYRSNRPVVYLRAGCPRSGGVATAQTMTKAENCSKFWVINPDSAGRQQAATPVG